MPQFTSTDEASIRLFTDRLRDFLAKLKDAHQSEAANESRIEVFGDEFFNDFFGQDRQLAKQMRHVSPTGRLLNPRNGPEMQQLRLGPRLLPSRTGQPSEVAPVEDRPAS